MAYPTLIAKPADKPKFADIDVTDSVSLQPNVVAPSTVLQNTGWTRNQYGARQFFNWLARWTYRWINWFEDSIDKIDVSTTALNTRTSTLETTVGAGTTGLVDRVLSVETTLNTPATGIVDRTEVLEARGAIGYLTIATNTSADIQITAAGGGTVTIGTSPSVRIMGSAIDNSMVHLEGRVVINVSGSVSRLLMVIDFGLSSKVRNPMLEDNSAETRLLGTVSLRGNATSLYALSLSSGQGGIQIFPQTGTIPAGAFVLDFNFNYFGN